MTFEGIGNDILLKYSRSIAIMSLITQTWHDSMNINQYIVVLRHPGSEKP